VAAVRPLFERLKQILQSPWYNAPVIEAALPTRHSERLAAARLSIREDGAVEAIQRAVNDRPRYTVEHSVLLSVNVKCLVECEVEMAAGVVDDPWSSFNRHVEGDLALFQRVSAHGTTRGPQTAENRDIVVRHCRKKRDKECQPRDNVSQAMKMMALLLVSMTLTTIPTVNAQLTCKLGTEAISQRGQCASDAIFFAAHSHCYMHWTCTQHLVCTCAPPHLTTITITTTTTQLHIHTHKFENAVRFFVDDWNNALGIQTDMWF
jgi:hypothetical protein